MDAKIIVGIKVDRAKLHVSEMSTVPHTEHGDLGAHAFCPKCGAPAVANVERIRCTLPPHPSARHDYEKNQYGPDYFTCWDGADFRVAADERTHWIALKLESKSDGRGGEFTPLTNLEALKAKLKAFLEPYGLWDEAQFGVYAYLN